MKRKHAISVLATAAVGVLGVRKADAQSAPTLTTLATFSSATSGTTGFNPAGQLYVDGSGDVLGTARSGGSGSGGTIFEYNGSSGLTARYSFTNGTDSYQPISGLVADSSGNLYGATNGPGNGATTTVFQLASNYTTFTTLATLSTTTATATTFGKAVAGALTLDASGNIYGTSTLGGSASYGTVFTVPKTGTTYATGSTTLANELSPNRPTSGLTLVGTTLYGVASPATFGTSGFGTLTATSTTATGGNVTNVLSFASANEGPTGKLVADANGNLFGESSGSGTTNTGTIFEITAGSLTAGAPAVTTLATFTTGTTGTGYNPLGGLIIDSKGDLFGTTFAGGASTFGTVFELPTSTTTATGYSAAATVLASLGSTSANNNLAYNSTLAVDAAGNLYGETYGATNSTTNQGTLYEVTNSGYAVGTPEPTSLVLLGAPACVGLLGRRRRR